MRCQIMSNPMKRRPATQQPPQGLRGHCKTRWCAAAMASLCMTIMLSPNARAQDTDPLALQATDDAPAPSSGLRLEAWAQTASLRPGVTGPAQQQQRLVLDFRREWSFGSQWKLGLSNRAEQVHANTGSELRNALREAYVSWQWGEGRYLDLGRLQWRNGVASGFNPSDFLKRGAVLDIGTQNPQALRENRLGTVMLRQQWLGDFGSLQLAYLPQLASHATTNPRAPAWERTNAKDAALLRWAPATGQAWTAEGLVYARAGDPLRGAVNLTTLIGDAWIVYGEWAGGRAARSGNNTHTSTDASTPSAHAQELALGATWTTPWVWTLTVERHQTNTPGTSDAWFARWAWDKALGRPDLNLAAFVRLNSNDRSRLWQIDARWNVNDVHTLALTTGRYSGSPHSEYGRVPTRGFGSVNWVMYF